MAGTDSSTAITPGSGDNVDEDVLTVGGTLVKRQRMRTAGAAAAELADVRNAQPTTSDYGLVVRPLPSKGSKAISVVSVLATATLILAANAGRDVAFLFNNGQFTVYLGPTSAVTVATGFPLPPGCSVVDGDSADAWYGIAAITGQDMHVLEVA